LKQFEGLEALVVQQPNETTLFLRSPKVPDYARNVTIPIRKFGAVLAYLHAHEGGRTPINQFKRYVHFERKHWVYDE
jgi:hypothetical protein